MKKIKKIVLILIVCLLILCAVFYCVTKRSYQSDVEEILSTYQLPSKLYVDSIYQTGELCTLSTLSMYRIKELCGEDTGHFNLSALELKFQDIDEILNAIDVDVELTEEQSQGFLQYAEEIIKADGLVQCEEQEDLSMRMIFTYDIVKFALDNNIELVQLDSIKKSVESMLNEVSIEDEVIYVSGLIQLAKELGISVERDILYDYLSVSGKTLIDSFMSGIDDIDVVDVYYLTTISNILNVKYEVSQEFYDMVAGALYYNYSTLSVFYDCAYILNSYNQLSEYSELIDECISDIDGKYLQDEGNYVRISSMTPSFLATYCALDVIRSEEIENENREAQLVYLEQYYLNDIMGVLDAEELYYYCACLELLGSKYCETTEFVLAVEECVNNLLQEENFSIRTMYCIVMLSESYSLDSLIKNIIGEVEELVKNMEGKSITVANGSMLRICEYLCYGESMLGEPVQEVYSIMDIFYLLEYASVSGTEIDEDSLENKLRRLVNENGYWVSETEKENTMFSFYLGYRSQEMLEKG